MRAVWRFALGATVLTTGCADDSPSSASGGDASEDARPGGHRGHPDGGGDFGDLGLGAQTDAGGPDAARGEDAALDVPEPDRLAWEGVWACTVVQTAAFDGSDAQPAGPAIAADLRAALDGSGLTLSSDSRDALRDCEVTFTIGAGSGSLASQSCAPPFWTGGELTWVGPG